MDSVKVAFEKGKAAGLAGVMKFKNPYNNAKTPLAFDAWIEGLLAGREEKAANK